jgi:hypothetical protein
VKVKAQLSVGGKETSTFILILMHVLLIGLGNMGKKYLSKLEEMGKLPVLCDRDPNKAVGSYPFYCHFEEVQEPTKAVIIAVDPAEHVRLAKFFLENGASVLLEKPPAFSKREFMEIYHHPTLYISEIESFSSALITSQRMWKRYILKGWGEEGATFLPFGIWHGTTFTFFSCFSKTCRSHPSRWMMFGIWREKQTACPFL